MATCSLILSTKPVTVARHNNFLLRYSLAIVWVVLASGCITPSPPGEVSALSVSAAQQSGLTGAPVVRWGGTITEVSNTDDGTVLQIVSRPLLGSGRPLRNDQTDGRFIAQFAQFLDPEIVKPGRDITVIGTLAGSESGVVGETSYIFPLVTADAYRYWAVQPIIARSTHSYPYYNSWDREFWHDWPYKPYHHHHYQRAIIRGELRF